MNIRQIGLMMVAVAVLSGCMTEQERKEYAIAQEITTSIQTCIKEGRYDEAEKLCEDGKAKCPTVDYDWAKAKSIVGQWRMKSKQDAKVRVENSKKRLEQYWRDIAEYNVSNVIWSAKDGVKLVNPYRTGDAYNWLASWVDARKKIVQEDYLAGESTLEEFGEKYMPNAYANFEKTRDAAREIAAVFSENFSNCGPLIENYRVYIKEVTEIRRYKSSRACKSKLPVEWSSFVKTLSAYSHARTQYFRRKDELSHYMLMWKAGALGAEDLAKIDSTPINVWLLEPMYDVTLSVSKRKTPDAKVVEFASKYLPESYRTISRLEESYEVTSKLFAEMESLEEKLDVVRFEMSDIAVREKLNNLVAELEKAYSKLYELKVEYLTMLNEADKIAKADQGLADRLKKFAKADNEYIRQRALGPIVGSTSMQSFYPADVLLRWHFIALGFCEASGFRCDTDRGLRDDGVRAKNGFEKITRANPSRETWGIDSPNLRPWIDPILLQLELVCPAGIDGRNMYWHDKHGDGQPLIYLDIPFGALFETEIGYYVAHATRERHKEYEGKMLAIGDRRRHFGGMENMSFTEMSANLRGAFCARLDDMYVDKKFRVVDMRSLDTPSGLSHYDYDARYFAFFRQEKNCVAVKAHCGGITSDNVKIEVR